MTFIEECKLRVAPVVGSSPSLEGQAAPSPSVLSAAGERSKLGQGPPCRSFADLKTFHALRAVSNDFLTCGDRQDIQDIIETWKPSKKATMEIIVLCNAVAKDLKGAVAAAHKRLQQSAEKETKSRKATAGTSAAKDSKVVVLFEAVPALVKSGNAKILQIPVAVTGGETKNDYTAPLMVNLASDTEKWKEIASPLEKILADFRLGFDSSPLRAAVGRGQKGLDKLSSDSNLAGKLEDVAFSPYVPASDRIEIDTDEKKELVGGAAVFGVAKNTVTCVPEKGYMPTCALTLAGSACFILVPITSVLSFFASHEGNANILLKDVLTLLKYMTAETLQKLLEHIGDGKVYHGTCGPNDVLYLPPTWLAIQSTGNADALGVKVRLLLPSLKDSMGALHAKLHFGQSVGSSVRLGVVNAL